MQFGAAPLERLLSMFDELGDDGREAMKTVLERYVQFIGVLGDPGSRQALGRETDSALRQQVFEWSTDIQESLVTIFFRDPLLRDLTEKYGLFLKGTQRP